MNRLRILIIASLLILSFSLPCYAQSVTVDEAKLAVGVYLGIDTTLIRNSVAMGQSVGGWNLRATGGGRLILDVAPLQPGTYLLTVRMTDGSVTAGRFVRQ